MSRVTQRSALVLSALLTACASAPQPRYLPSQLATARSVDSLADSDGGAARVSITSNAAALSTPAVANGPITFAAQAIDIAVLNQVIQQRVSEVEARAITDLLQMSARPGGATASAPLVDLMEAFSALVVPTGDGDTRAQNLALSIVRVGTTFALYYPLKSSSAPPPAVQTCLAHDSYGTDLANAVYQGLARSQTFHGLGFTMRGSAIPSECDSVSTLVTTFADKLGEFGRCSWTTPPDDTQTPGVIVQPAAPGAGTPPATNVACPDPTTLRTEFANAAGALGFCGSNHAQNDITCNEFGLGLIAVSLGGKLAHGTPLRRADVLDLTRVLQDALRDSLTNNGGEQCPAVPTDDFSRSRGSRCRALRLVNAVMAAIRTGIREEVTPATTTTAERVRLSIDASAATSSMLTEYSDQSATGLYLRATIGTGYICTSHHGQCEVSAWEELGGGYRWPFCASRHVTHGFHGIVSGLLHQIVTPNYGANHLFVGVGWSFNFYRILDLSATVGALFDVAHGPEPQAAVFVGLQVPLADYLQALTSGSSAPQVQSTQPR